MDARVIGIYMAAVFALLVSALSPVSAQEREVIAGSDWSATIGVNGWLTTGQSKWEHKIPFAPGLTLGSRLSFNDVDSKIMMLDADFVWKKLVLTGAGGWGAIDDGELIDEDFVNGVDFSRTRSSIDDGSVYLANANAGIRVAEWFDSEKRRGFLDLLVGYQWWREKYQAFGLHDELGLSPDIGKSTKVLTEQWTWQSVRVGGRLEIPVPARFGVRVSAFFLPWSSLEVEDVHRLRSDLRQNPSIVLNATGGFGWQAEGAITYAFWRGLGAEVGYRHWELTVKGGDVKFRAANGNQPEFDLKKVSTDRHGPFFALYYRF